MKNKRPQHRAFIHNGSILYHLFPLSIPVVLSCHPFRVRNLGETITGGYASLTPGYYHITPDGVSEWIPSGSNNEKDARVARLYGSSYCKSINYMCLSVSICGSL